MPKLKPRPTRCPRGIAAPAKQAIVSFVKETTTQGSPQFVDPVARIATFDKEGARLEMLVHHDDATREYAYGPSRRSAPSRMP
jgi:hypothetical protein